MKTLAITLLICIGFSTAYAQDKLVFKNDEEKNVKVLEIGLDEVKYKDWPMDVEAPIMSVDKEELKKLILESGKEYAFNGDNFSNPNLYADQKKNAIKVNFLSPMYDNLQLGYERSIKPGQSIEGQIGIVGIGYDMQEQNAAGAFIKIGYKFIRTPDYKMRGMKYSHILKGGYIKPEITYTYYEHDTYYYDPYMYTYVEQKVRTYTSGFSVMLNLGKQWIFDDIFLVDIYAGLGYGFVDSGADEYTGAMHGFLGGADIPVAGNAGVKMGILIK